MSNWKTARSSEKSIEHGDGSKKYSVISGTIRIPDDPLATSPANQVLVLAIAVPILEENFSVKARMTHTFTLLSSISYSKPVSEDSARELRTQIEKEAVNGILQVGLNIRR